MGGLKKPKGAFLGDPLSYIRAGIDPVTGQPTRGGMYDLKSGMRKILRIIDQQDAVNRYKWYNIPMDLTSEEIETLLYYYGTLAFFYFKELDKFYLMPYTLNGHIDFYGRYNFITPVPIASTTDSKEEKARYESQKKTLSALKLKVAKAPIDLEDLTLKDFEESAVILYDYSKQRSQIIIPRQQLNEAIIEVESDIIPFLRTSMIQAAGVRGMKVDDADTREEAERVSKQLYASALKGEIYSPFTAKIDVQELTEGTPVKSEEFLLTLQALENFRLGTYGIKNGGLFQKKAHELQDEANMNAGGTQTSFDDGLAWRQHFCNIVNSIWGCSMWCEPNEAVINLDVNSDGVAYDRDLGDKGGTSEGGFETATGGQKNV